MCLLWDYTLNQWWAMKLFTKKQCYIAISLFYVFSRMDVESLFLHSENENKSWTEK